MIINWNVMIRFQYKDSIYTGLIFLLLLLPATHQLRPLSFPVGSFYITATESILFLIMIVWVIQGLSATKKIQRKLALRILIYLFASFFSVHLLVGIFIYGPVMAFGDFRQYIPIALYFPLVHIYRSEQAISHLRKAMFWLLIIVALYTTFVFAFFNDFMTAMALKQGTKLLSERIVMFNSLMVLFSYLGFIIAILFTGEFSYKKRAICLCILSLNSIMLLIMQSRTQWLIFILISFLSAFSFKNNFKKIIYLFNFGYCIIFFVSIGYLCVYTFDYTPSIVKRVQDSVVDRAASFMDIGKIGQKKQGKAESIATVETRVETSKLVAEEYVLPNLLFGLGFGAQLPVVNKFGEVYSWKFQIDNGYLTILAKFGLIGFALYLVLTTKIIFILFKILKSPQIENTDALIAKSFLYMISALIIGSFFSSIFIRQQASIVGFLIMISEVEFLNSKYRK